MRESGSRDVSSSRVYILEREKGAALHTLAIDASSKPEVSSLSRPAREHHEVRRQLERLYDLHAGPIYRWAVGMLGGRQQAEDAVQSVWLKLARNADRLAAVSDSRAYLWGVARNHVSSVLRRRALERIWIRPLDRNETEEIPVSADHGTTGDERRDLVRAVRRLRPRFRAVVLLVSFAGCTIEEAAKCLGIPRGTAASRHHAALQKLKGFLETEG